MVVNIVLYIKYRVAIFIDTKFFFNSLHKKRVVIGIHFLIPHFWLSFYIICVMINDAFDIISLFLYPMIYKHHLQLHPQGTLCLFWHRNDDTNMCRRSDARKESRCPSLGTRLHHLTADRKTKQACVLK